MGDDEVTDQQTSFEAAGVFMTVQEIIDALSTMPRDADVTVLFDGERGACGVTQIRRDDDCVKIVGY